MRLDYSISGWGMGRGLAPPQKKLISVCYNQFSKSNNGRQDHSRKRLINYNTGKSHKTRVYETSMTST